MEELKAGRREEEQLNLHLGKLLAEVEGELTGTEGGSLVERIQHLLESEARLAREVEEHEKKELAFRETLSEADVIMSSIEQGYHSRVSELEEVRLRLEEQLAVQGQAEERLRQALREKPEAGQVSKLLDCLGEAESTEQSLKEKIYYLEKNNSDICLRLQAELKAGNDMREQLKDQEDVLARLAHQEAQLHRMEAEMQQKQELEFRHSELAQSEEFLRGRVEELEGVEHALRDNMASVVQTATLRERRLEDHLARISEELEQQSSNVTSYEDACGALRGEEGGLRMEVARLQYKVEEAGRREADLAEAEDEVRAELVKARGTVERINKQLSELDGHNCELEGRAASAEEDLENTRKKLALALDTLEQAKLEHCRVEEELEHLKEGSKEENQKTLGQGTSEEKEMDEIARSEGGLMAVTKEVAEAAALVTECRECSPALGGRLTEAAAQLSLLSSVICGGEEDTNCRESELLRCESEEYLVKEEGGAAEEEEMLGSQLAELQEKFGR